MKKLIILLFSISYIVVSAQNVPPSMMVVPYTSSGKLALEIYEEDEKYRAIIAGIEKAIIDRGGVLHNLQPVIQNAREDMLRWGANAPDILDVMNMKNEITVAAEITYNSNGPRVTVEVRLKAVEALTGAIVYSGSLFMLPPLSLSSDFQLITATVLSTPDTRQENVQLPYIDEFLNGMQSAFTKMIKNGQELTVIIKTDDDSNYLLNQEANDEHEMISEIIDEWVASKAVNGNFRYEEVSKLRKEIRIRIRLRDLAITPTVIKIRVPYRTAEGKPYSSKRFSKEFRKAILRICWQASKTMGSENKPDGGSMRENVDKGTIMLTMPAFR